MQQHESARGRSTIPNPPISFGDTGAAEKWSAMEQHMGHPLLQSLRGIRQGTLRVYLPDGSEVFYLGANPGYHANMRFADWKTLDRIAVEGEIALGEEYAAGRWDTTDLRKLLRVVAQNGGVFDRSPATPRLSRLARFARRKIFAGGGRKSLHPPHSLGNDFYSLWLGKTMSFSGGLFNGDAGIPLEEAQRATYRRALGRLGTQKGEHILDLGCGFGGFMDEAARLGVHATGVTLEAEQAAFAQERLAGFAGLADIKLDDYRRVKGTFDDIVSFGTFETVGEARWPDFMECVFRNLRPGGRAVIQTTVVADDHSDAYARSVDFAREHIAPGSFVPSRRGLEQAARRAGLQINDIYHFGRDQAITFDSWFERFTAAEPKLRDLGYPEALLLKWAFHLANRAAQFETRRLDMIQVEFSRPRH